jgi:hypothetical protein
MKTFLKRLIAAIGMFLAAWTFFDGMHDFRAAETGVEVFKALFFTLIGGFAFFLFAEDFKEKKWPFQL